MQTIPSTRRAIYYNYKKNKWLKIAKFNFNCAPNIDFDVLFKIFHCQHIKHIEKTNMYSIAYSRINLFS